MPRYSFKPESSFFRKIVIGAVGAQAVCKDLSRYGHKIIELENGSTNTRIWKDVKRKRVRIPDLLCINCGMRIECRAKTKRVISMSHSFTDAERAWDYGMVNSDIVSFPICEPNDEHNWTSEKFEENHSYFHQRERVKWNVFDHINYISVENLREISHSKHSTKGVIEGSETSIEWDAIISSRNGIVEYIKDDKIGIRRSSDGHLYAWKNTSKLPVWVSEGQKVNDKQILASNIRPLSYEDLECKEVLQNSQINDMIFSPERTQRYAGIKLLRYRNDPSFRKQILKIISHPDEDLYIQLEGIIYLSKTCGEHLKSLIYPFLNNIDEQVQLEAIIALSEISTKEAVEILDNLLSSEVQPYYKRSATAWALGQIGTDEAIDRLILAFADVDTNLREEALDALDAINGNKVQHLIDGLKNEREIIAAGSAEAIRRTAKLTQADLLRIINGLEQDDNSEWSTWLLGHITEDRNFIVSELSKLQDTHPKVHYAISVLWTFVDSWIAKHWEITPNAKKV
jgi:hypothetical protein